MGRVEGHGWKQAGLDPSPPSICHLTGLPPCSLGPLPQGRLGSLFNAPSWAPHQLSEADSGLESQKPVLSHTFQVAAHDSQGPIALRAFLPGGGLSSCLPSTRSLQASRGRLALSGEGPFSFLMPTCVSAGPSVTPGTPVHPCLWGRRAACPFGACRRWGWEGAAW